MLKPGTLWARVIEKTDHALRCGALQPIPTKYEFVEQGRIQFLVRTLANLVRKDEAKQQEKATTGKEFNPFLPYDEDLFVADISDTHVCLLNKFNVIDHHLLIVTRSFEEQETWLTLEDFQAMWVCLCETEGLAFYNAGKTAGASQRHKHLQLIPLPLVSTGPKVPIEPALGSATFQGCVGTTSDFPFVHAIARLDSCWTQSPSAAAEVTLERYYTLLRAVGLHGVEGSQRQTGAYNLLVTRQWMLLVPRTQEYFQSISINSLGFAGALLVRDEQQMKLLKDYGPLSTLRHVAVPAAYDLDGGSYSNKS